GHGLDLGRGQDVGGRGQHRAVERHAVDAAEVAVVDEGYTQVVDLAAEGVARHGRIFGPAPGQVNSHAPLWVSSAARRARASGRRARSGTASRGAPRAWPAR